MLTNWEYSIIYGPRHTPNPSTLKYYTSHQKMTIFFGGGYEAPNILFNFGDTTMIWNMKNIMSKFQIDL